MFEQLIRPYLPYVLPAMLVKVLVLSYLSLRLLLVKGLVLHYIPDSLVESGLLVLLDLGD